MKCRVTSELGLNVLGAPFSVIVVDSNTRSTGHSSDGVGLADVAGAVGPADGDAALHPTAPARRVAASTRRRSLIAQGRYRRASTRAVPVHSGRRFSGLVWRR